MHTTDRLLEAIIEKRSHLNELKAQSPEIAEAITLAEEYHALFLELLDRYRQATPNIVPVPYPVAPQLYPHYRTTTAPGTTLAPAINYDYRIISTTSLL